MTGAHLAPASRIELDDALPALATLIAAALLSGAAGVGSTALGLAVLATQALVTLAWLAVTDVDGSDGASVIVLVGAAAANVLAVRDEGSGIGTAVVVVALAFVASLAWQLFRKDRQRTAEALGGTTSAMVLCVLASHLLSLSAKNGPNVVTTAMLCAAAALVVGRVGDFFALRPSLATGAKRGLLGLLLATVAAGGAGAALGSLWAPLSVSSGTVLGLACGLSAVAADLGIDLADADATDERRAAALRPLAVLLPLVVAAPVAYAAARLLIG